MSMINPDYYLHQEIFKLWNKIHKLIMDLTVEKSELKNQVIRLKKQLNQLQKDSKK